MHGTHYNQTEELLREVVHELRQPLGTIETSAFVLNLLMPDAPSAVHDYIRIIERQVDIAARMLDAAAAEMVRLHAQRAEAMSRDRTNSVTAAVA